MAAAPPPPHAAVSSSERVLWNFTEPGATVDGWVESSDGTAREAGMSTGAFKLQVRRRVGGAERFTVTEMGRVTRAEGTRGFA